MRTAALLAVSTGLALTACKNVVPDATEPALIVEPTEASRAALQATINGLLDTEVVLSGEALTDTSFLFIERRVPQSIDGSPAKGRNMDLPYRFTLLTNGTDCVLVDERDDSRHLLANTKCVAADGGPESQ